MSVLAMTRGAMFTKLNHKLCFRRSSALKSGSHPHGCAVEPPNSSKMRANAWTSSRGWLWVGRLPVRDLGPGVLHCLAPCRMQVAMRVHPRQKASEPFQAMGFQNSQRNSLPQGAGRK